MSDVHSSGALVQTCSHGHDSNVRGLVISILIISLYLSKCSLITFVRYDLMSSTKDGLHDSEHIVGGPSDEEDQEDERQCLCCFSLLLLFLKDFIII